MTNRSVLLLATNKKEYFKFALNCAESIKLHNPGLQIFIATNIKIDEQFVGIKLLTITEELAKLNIETKLYLDNFLQTEETIYIDSDCLCFGNLGPIFQACQNMHVTVIGRPVPLEQYWGGVKNAEFARMEFAIDKSILFTGGFYYIKKTALAHRIYDKAREISTKYDEYGFHRIKDAWKNEEDLISIAMIAHKQLPIDDNGQYMSDFVTDRRPKVLNVLKGERVLRNFIPPRNHYPSSYSPIILHFGGSNIKSYPYISQSFLLGLYKRGFSIVISSLIVGAFIHGPYRTYHWLRELLRFNKLK